MDWIWLILAAVLALGLGLGTGIAFPRLQRRRRRGGRAIAELVKAHFRPTPINDLAVTERKFPFRVRADLQRALDEMLANNNWSGSFSGVRKDFHRTVSFTSLLGDDHSPAQPVPPEYEEVDIGEPEPVRCLKNGLWLLTNGHNKFAIWLTPDENYTRVTGMLLQIVTLNDGEGNKVAQRFFKPLEEAIQKAGSYRGKVLSLEQEDSYSGTAAGIKVHRLNAVSRDQVILPRKTLELLERNVLRFVAERPRLSALGQATKKGLLFYGPPGTGKTHTLHYLAGALPGHTMLLITAEQVGQLADYMLLARLLQPSVIVIEDADLIARERTDMHGPCEEVLLNKLLNEMDGLREDANLLFILTSNHPEALERALASRPGRVDQAIEFPLPDEESRAKLVRLYSAGMEVPASVASNIVERTADVSGAFIKELMRRSLQFHLERDDSRTISLEDVTNAMEEMLFAGGSLNLKLLGATGASFGFRPTSPNIA